MWIFTTTVDGLSLFDGGLDSHPLLSRCIEITLSSQGVAPAFARRAQEIATIENLNGQPLAAYTRLINECQGNFRQALQRIEKGDMLV
jgi:hypothetical protein